MTDSTLVSDVRSALVDLVEKLNLAGQSGVKFEFQINTDPFTLQSALARFVAYQRVDIKDN